MNLSTWKNVQSLSHKNGFTVKPLTEPDVGYKMGVLAISRKKDMKQGQKEALLDLRAYIDFALKEHVSFYSVLGTIGHDVNGLFNGDAEFLPRTSGYSKPVKIV